jgi:DnaJ-class molecular chaperone
LFRATSYKQYQILLNEGGAIMQQCGDCLKVYDESENVDCPFCSDEEEGNSLADCKCEECSGSGMIECSECDGEGVDMDDKDEVCIMCNGVGELVCLDCDGTGWRQE